MPDAKLEVKKPKFAISGGPSIKQCEILNNKRHILTKDTENAVSLLLRISHCFIEGPPEMTNSGFLTSGLASGIDFGSWYDAALADEKKSKIVQ